MKKLLLLLFISALVLQTLAQESKEFILSGSLNGPAYSDFIYLGYGNTKDSMKVSDNSFEFRGKIDKATQAWIHLKADPDALIDWVYLEHSHISIDTDYSVQQSQNGKVNIIKITDIRGSETAKLQANFKAWYR
ncbi:MAG: DUF4369 domain-containing protein [Bacteroidota bacterium]